GPGALDSAAGVNAWDMPITLAGDTSLGADVVTTGAAPVKATLTLERTLGESVVGTNVTKVGGGNVVFSGPTSNTYTGLTTVAAAPARNRPSPAPPAWRPSPAPAAPPTRSRCPSPARPGRSP